MTETVRVGYVVASGPGVSSDQKCFFLSLGGRGGSWVDMNLFRTAVLKIKWTEFWSAISTKRLIFPQNRNLYDLHTERYYQEAKRGTIFQTTYCCFHSTVGRFGLVEFAGLCSLGTYCAMRNGLSSDLCFVGLYARNGAWPVPGKLGFYITTVCWRQRSWVVKTWHCGSRGSQLAEAVIVFSTCPPLHRVRMIDLAPSPSDVPVNWDPVCRVP